MSTLAASLVLSEVLKERVRQEELWGQQNHPDGTGPLLVLEGFPQWQDSVAGAMHIESWAKRRCDTEHAGGRGTYEMILTEEWAEVIASDEPAKLRVELIQLAAVAAGWVEKIDRDLAARAPTEKAAHHAVVFLPAVADAAAPALSELQSGTDLTRYFADFGTCGVCDQTITGSHYHCPCGTTDVTGMYGHHSTLCKVATKREGVLVNREFHHCGPDGACSLEPEPLLCPECANGKPVNCALVALDPSIDDFVPCATTKAVS